MPSENIKRSSESLINLLGAQCSDLEKLLSLAKDETAAAQEGKFLKVWDIVSERAKIGRRLEAFHRQIAELRDYLESHGENVGQYDITNRVVEFANLTLLQDQKTRQLLTESRDKSYQELKNLDRAQAGTVAYLKENHKGLAYDGNF